MCLIALALHAHPRFPLAVAANRDEFHDRPAAAAARDPGAADVYGGRDLVRGGGWLQVSERGRLAAVTNVRTGDGDAGAVGSRGWLVRDFVRGTVAARAGADALLSTATGYGPFNLLLWDGEALAFIGNHPHPASMAVAPGLHAMSNGAFDARWPKSVRASRALQAWLQALPGDAAVSGAPALAPLFDALADTTVAPDDALPDTGVGLALERALSPPFVAGARYGTRCSSVVLFERGGGIVFAERRFGPDAALAGESFARLPLRDGR